MLTITRGDDYLGVRRLTVLVTDPNNANAPVDLTNVECLFMVKARQSDADADALISKSTPTGIALGTQSGGTLGTALISIAGSDTDALEEGYYYWELQAEDAIGVITLASGRFVLVADLIREA